MPPDGWWIGLWGPGGSKVVFCCFLAEFGPIWPNWPNLAEFGRIWPIWPNSADFELFGGDFFGHDLATVRRRFASDVKAVRHGSLLFGATVRTRFASDVKGVRNGSLPGAGKVSTKNQPKMAKIGGFRANPPVLLQVPSLCFNFSQ